MEPLTGKLTITCIQANAIRKVQLMGIQDPYTIFEIGKQKKKTKTHKDGNTNPVWKQDVEFDLKDSGEKYVNVKVYNDNVGIDDLIAVIKLPLAALLSSEKEHWYPLYRDTKYRFGSGKILLKCKFEGKGGFPAAPSSSKFGLLSAHYGTRDIQADVLGFLETKVANMKLEFKEEEDLSKYFGFDPMDGHISSKMLYVTYLHDNEEVTAVVQEKHGDFAIDLEDYELRKAEAEKAMLARKEMEAKQAAAELAYEKKMAEERAKKEAELKAALEAKLKEKEAEAKNVEEMRQQMAADLARKETKIMELTEKINALEAANADLTAENSRLENENEKYRAEKKEQSNRKPKIFGMTMPSLPPGAKDIGEKLKKFNPFG